MTLRRLGFAKLFFKLLDLPGMSRGLFSGVEIALSLFFGQRLLQRVGQLVFASVFVLELHNLLVQTFDHLFAPLHKAFASVLFAQSSVEIGLFLLELQLNFLLLLARALLTELRPFQI